MSMVHIKIIKASKVGGIKH
uniref:Uncharacterized protein n=1 Tax=Arundo donax TaxID=35708 RepID=A0A0A9HMT3_ARUDO